MAMETLGSALRQINYLFADGTLTGLSDAHLLERFVGRHDPGSFEVLVARHGPMVLSVCRGILRDPNDAEDAFQATFMILVKKAGTIRGRVVLGGWLYQVAHRVAVHANIAAARRRAHEREAGQMTTASVSSSPAVWDDLLPACTRRSHGCPRSTACRSSSATWRVSPRRRPPGNCTGVNGRSAAASPRPAVGSRVAWAGVAMQPIAQCSALFLRESRTAVPAIWQEATVRAALDLVNHTLVTGAVSVAAGSLTREVLKVMLLQKLKLVTAALLGMGLMTWVAAAAFLSRRDEPQRPATAPVARRGIPPAATQRVPEPDPLDAVGTFPVRGRVLDPDGKPVAGAEIYVHHYNFDAMASTTGNTVPSYKSGRVATSDADGRFRFELDKGASDFPYRDWPAWHGAEIAAVAPGYGPAWLTAESLLKLEEGTASWRLVRDDVPIRGRVLDSQGRPVAGVTVHASEIREADTEADKEALSGLGRD